MLPGIISGPDAAILRGDIARAFRDQAESMRSDRDPALAAMAGQFDQIADRLDGIAPEAAPLTVGRPIQLEERQLVRPDGTVLLSVTIPANVRWAPDLHDRIEGHCLVRVRDLPDGEWEVIAQFPDGYPPALDGDDR